MKRSLFIIASLLLCLTTYAECYIVEGGSCSGTTAAAGTVMGTFMFNGLPTNGSVAYTAKTSRSGLDIKIQYTTDGSAWMDAKTQSITNRDANYTCTISTQSIGVRFVNVSKYNILGGTYTNTFSNIKIGMATVLSAASSSVTLPTTSAGTAVSANNTITYSNLDGAVVTTSITGDDASLFQVTNSKSSLDCSGTFGITAWFYPTEETAAGTYSATVTISAGAKTCSFPVSATVTADVITSIRWDQKFTNLLSTADEKTITLAAQVVDADDAPINGATIIYSSDDPSVVSINGNVLTIVANGKTTINANYAGAAGYTPAMNIKQVIVSDGSMCTTMLVDDGSKVSIGAYQSTKTYAWTAPAGATFSFNLWKQGAGTQGAKVECKNANGTTLKTYSYSNGNIKTNSTRITEVLPSGTKSLEFSATGSLDKYIQSVSVEQEKYLTALSSSLSAEGTYEASTTVLFKYSDMPTAISASLDDAENAEVELICDVVGEGCGDWSDNASLLLTFKPKSTNQNKYSYSGYLVLSAGAREGAITSVQIPLEVQISMPYGDLNNGFAMVYNAQELLLGGATQAYIAQWVDDPEGTMLNLVSVLQDVDGDGNKHLAKETPALLYNEEEDFYTYKVEVNPTLAPNLGASNAFVYTGGSFSQDNEAYNYYVLGANGSNEVAFYKYTGTIPAGKVVLAWEKSQGGAAPQRIDIRMAEDIATALVPVWAEEDHAADSRFDGQIYTIMGLPVSSMSQPGIYIQNGKKIVVR